MELKIPVLALVDSDPYGLKILAVYMKGARAKLPPCLLAYCGQLGVRTCRPGHGPKANLGQTPPQPLPAACRVDEHVVR